ncbi:hypothetical protein LEP1GSC103_3923 [Leptospira borgpetersenii serovar Javanica str. UI 09931]|uniref:Uncharacterized protein n=4 Tax=Leptospira borgpetersenii TaxID=174 RepID=M3HUW4_LEPBO|nr:hypothetical protein LBBP_00670 [Leptospira borgpetersenii serovar Ballum]EKP15406.1 hypothetical protein LEP1GSC128_2127 [Leptospira borgpetersenii str. 200801926]EKR02342.1 hypothetical protein LEP1GSC121_0950 [Leptospira borgpetersenii serovar Castellonis str. 200801910]EMG01370.1 hypothetical protein LEP1GSC123_3799 [Leptospira borgpetersenii str. 200701203]EMK11504.1 hypothetical protein LEP1GSC066_1776 [Leptospira sp. serovar Kenya str. Sh9]EMN12572.1 hypothetical protein LEP1GSC055_1
MFYVAFRHTGLIYKKQNRSRFVNEKDQKIKSGFGSRSGNKYGKKRSRREF